MRTALILLLFLAVAALPGSLLPQRTVSPEKVDRYLRAHPSLGMWLDRLWGFDVYASPWFSAIYLLLLVSLVGCLVPRAREHMRALFRPPPPAPARLERLPIHTAGFHLEDDSAAVAARLRTLLRRHRYRTIVRVDKGGECTLSAEKGFLAETGNLLFHLALLAILAGVALGSWYGWHANRILVQGADQAFCNTLQQYDDYALGARVSSTDLSPFCLQLDSFRADYIDNGQPIAFTASVTQTAPVSPDRATDLSVNSPLRLPGATVYLLGHGYAPVIRYTDRNGRTQTDVAPFLPEDASITSTGVAAFPDVNTNPVNGPDAAAKQQVAFAGVYMPTAPADTTIARSMHPAEHNPVLMLVAYRGDLGVDAGVPRSVYTLDQRLIDSGALTVAGPPLTLRPGQSAKLDDATTVEFLGTRQWVTISVRYDPGQGLVLAGAVLLLLGLIPMLAGRRRRMWFRITPVGTTSHIIAAALARGQDIGLAADLERLVNQVRSTAVSAGAGP